jgi:hypothetical protein
MVIKPSSAGEIRQLIDALASGDDVRREAAIGRLGVIGGRAVEHLLAAYQGAERTVRVAMLRALEPAGDIRTLAIARAALAEGGDLGVAAAGVLRELLDNRHAATATASLDALVATALDAGASHRLRLAAFDALRDVPDARDRVASALRAEQDPLLDPAPGRIGESTTEDAVWQDAVGGRLPDRPEELRELVPSRAAVAPLSTVQNLIDRVRAHEATVRGGSDQWQALRGALHQALALRGSRVALYDLRESIERAEAPLPASFLAALQAVGDRSCLEPAAAAYARVPDRRWRYQLKEAFRAIARRERIARRHAVVKRITARWGDVVAELIQ